MRKSSSCAIASISAVAFLLPSVGLHASETKTFQYDALGRLMQSTSSGGAVNGQQIKTSFDPAGNRTNQTITGVNGSSAPPPPPPPTPNLPPVANLDNGTLGRCSLGVYDVTANDTDPESNYPLSLVSVSGGFTTTILDSKHVSAQSGTNTGIHTITYDITDSLGAASTGTLKITVTQTQCSTDGQHVNL